MGRIRTGCAFFIFYKSYIPLGEAEPEDMTRPKVASRGEVARGLRPSGGATSYSPRYAGPLPPPTAPGILCSSRNSIGQFKHCTTISPTIQQPRSNHPSCRNRVVRGVDIFLMLLFR